MKRDMDLVRKILLALEEKDSPNSPYLHIDGYNTEMIGYHCSILYQYGLVQYFKTTSADNNQFYCFFVNGLTWEGHDFLDKIRDDGTWQKTVKTIAENGLDMSIKTVGTIATAFISATTEGVVAAILKSGGTP